MSLEPLVKVDGIWWPKSERGLQGDLKSLADVENLILPKCKQRRTAIQAGGAAGLWARELSNSFETVYSFEPNPTLYECLKRNTESNHNVFAWPFGLWHEEAFGTPGGIKDWNMGSWSIKLGEGDGILRTVDSFYLKDVDLMLLDIEGAEVNALKGATDTIARCKPVIVVETKEACLREFGFSKYDLRVALKEMGYRLADTFHGGRDELWLPKY